MCIRDRVCVYGQLLLLDLIERLAPYAQIIQSNTDGVLGKMPEGQDEDQWYSLIDDIAHEWEVRTGPVSYTHLDVYKRQFCGRKRRGR